ncbi:MAG: TIGR03905 family TSCPD domain-containing protein [Schwartzia sp.]|nr:TIGR03905 family TSCPD domain-containing protein [Schwartzia sp. (in: firmicutes)]
MFSYTYQTKGTCSRAIEVVLDGKTIQSVSFAGGCPGNLSGISKMVEGMDIDFVIGKLAGTRCGNRPTSCPAQLTIALREAYAAQEGK